ncbi:MAG: hypothetical protein GYA55_11385 [SAR324 cluster bacterium]|uniref:Uncharacterized protein n=1 Tax=SAR324 cluster bacterium TaxID=2024889 RepID=A0A7X9FT01_9DELT|nr:hypothetical protein [SAR324 cluster bacterium]
MIDKSPSITPTERSLTIRQFSSPENTLHYRVIQHVLVTPIGPEEPLKTINRQRLMLHVI